MRAVQVVSFDGPAAVVVREVAAAEPGPGEVVVEVRAAGVAYPDLLHTRGLYQERFEPPFTLGGECAGIVASAPDRSRFAPGDRVVAMVRHGAFAGCVAVPEFLVQPLPDEVSFVQGACLPVNYLTAHHALCGRGALAAGETVLVHGAAGGIGTATVQLARALGARVVAVTSSEEKAALARRVGAHDVVGAASFREDVRALTGGEGVDVVVDPVGGDRFTDSLRCLRSPGGRVLVVGFVGGSIPTVKVNRLLLTNTDVRGVGWGGPAFGVPGFVTGQWDALLPHLRAGALDPPVAEVLPVDRVADALAALDDRRALGKLVLHF
ncbi:NADPH:quinone oxidoreductase family protein [Pseudonocardia broussonetiae]|uniref:NADPH:quinone oxidoreductase family protein n=1 Tax=Pseudonocardia broussonetiae TaxID=2736640 RepID=A0A6M6JRS8_9PSEU|nr:NADPH:quinone oxidoreductase family protein [Pseudonocardia broussonetiae]QJY49923.1 NADPH:quinone oxidoreductase family protein [Pseudonocardia broussonetiae]